MKVIRDMFGRDIEVDTAPYGATLAGRVADFLATGQSISYGHRDYCGMGLFCAGGTFIYSSVHDGMPIPDNAQILFSNRDDFVRWLSEQSDETLFNWGNQPITRVRLEAALQS